MKRVLFTGGGTAGHVTPNLGVIEQLQEEGWTIAYVGSKTGIERELLHESGIEFFAIATGKLRRYISWQNLIDPFRVLLGLFQSIWICLRWSPDVVFSKGGFVAVPVVAAAWLCRIPVIAHESDTSPGLATRLSAPFAVRICVNFEQTLDMLPKGKGQVTGSPVRRSILSGNGERAARELGLSGKPMLLVFGGSLGASAINRSVRQVLDTLCQRFDVVHVTGPGQIDPGLQQTGYWQREFIGAGFGDVFAAADLVIARAGANTIYELLVTRTPHILIPLPRAASRGDQIENAVLFEQLEMSRVIFQENLDGDSLLAEVDIAWQKRASQIVAMEQFEVKDSCALIVSLIEEFAKR